MFELEFSIITFRRSFVVSSSSICRVVHFSCSSTTWSTIASAWSVIRSNAAGMKSTSSCDTLPARGRGESIRSQSSSTDPGRGTSVSWPPPPSLSSVSILFPRYSSFVFVYLFLKFFSWLKKTKQNKGENKK